MEGRRKRVIKFLLCILHSIFFTMCCFCVHGYAQEREEHCGDGEFSLAVTFSYQDEDAEEITLRAGRDFPLRFSVQAPAGFCGYINVLMQNAQEKHLLYSQWVEEDGLGEGISAQMLLPMNLMTKGLYLTLTDEAGEVLLENEIPVEDINYGQYELVAVFDPAEEEAGENPYAHFSAYGNRLLTVSESEMACGARAMDALEVIVTQESVLDELAKSAGEANLDQTPKTGEANQAAQAQESLKEWVAGGKTLVVGAGTQEGAKKEMLNFGLQEKDVLQEVILQVGNYEATRENILSMNEEIKKQYGENTRTYYIGDSMLGGAFVNSLSDKAVALPVATLGEGGHWWDFGASYEVLWEEHGKDIVRCYYVGEGRVLVFAVPITTSQKETYPLFYYRMVGLVLDNLAPVQLERQNTEMYGYSGSNRSYLLSDIQTKNNGISVFPYVAILLVYILVLIPAVFLLLRHLGKTKYLWGALPVLAFAVMGVIYLVGSRTRLTKPYCTYIDVMDYSGADGVETINFSLSSSKSDGAEILLRAGSEVRFSENGFSPYEIGWLSDSLQAENILRAREYRAAVSILPDGVKLSVNAIRAFAKTYFYAQADAPEITGEISVKVATKGKVVAGTVRNTTDLAFRDVYVCNYNFLVRVGSMQPGEELLLENCRQALNEDPDGNYGGNEIYWLMQDSAVGRQEYVVSGIMWDLYTDYVLNESGKTFIFAVPEEEMEGILGVAARNAGSGGQQVLIWDGSMDGEGN